MILRHRRIKWIQPPSPPLGYVAFDRHDIGLGREPEDVFGDQVVQRAIIALKGSDFLVIGSERCKRIRWGWPCLIAAGSPPHAPDGIGRPHSGKNFQLMRKS